MHPTDIILDIESGRYSQDDMEEVIEWYYLSIKKHIEELASLKKALARNRSRLEGQFMATHFDRRCAEILSWIKNLIETLETQEAEFRKP